MLKSSAIKMFYQRIQQILKKTSSEIFTFFPKPLNSKLNFGSFEIEIFTGKKFIEKININFRAHA
jgi:hypothetical protein